MNCDKYHWLSPYAECPTCKKNRDESSMIIQDAVIDVGIAVVESLISSPTDDSSLETPVDSSWDGGGGDFSGGGANGEF